MSCACVLIAGGAKWIASCAESAFDARERSTAELGASGLGAPVLARSP